MGGLLWRARGQSGTRWTVAFAVGAGCYENDNPRPFLFFFCFNRDARAPLCARIRARARPCVYTQTGRVRASVFTRKQGACAPLCPAIRRRGGSAKPGLGRARVVNGARAGLQFSCARGAVASKWGSIFVRAPQFSFKCNNFFQGE